MSTLGEVHSTVSRWLRRGNVFDVDVPGAVRQAVRSIERNYSLKYMERYVTFTIPWTSPEPRAINFPDTKVKSIIFLRVVNADNSFTDLIQMDPRELRSVTNGMPLRYWLDGMDYIWFDKKPDQDYAGEMFYNRYTTWPTAADPNWLDTTNWILDNADDAVVGHALGHMKILTRLPPDIRQEIDTLVTRAMGELTRADEEMRRANTSETMNYGTFR